MLASKKADNIGSKASSYFDGQPLPDTKGFNRQGELKSISDTRNSFDLSTISILSPSSAKFQPKLNINTPGDKYEQEADRVADQIMQMPAPLHNGTTDTIGNVSSIVQRKCSKCEEEDELQTKSNGQTTQTVSPALSNQIQNTKGGGKTMDASTKDYMSSRFNKDFSAVRIHTDSKAIQMNSVVNSRAFTVGNDIYFNQGQYNPAFGEGKRLLAHELVHTIQQGGIRSSNDQKDTIIQRQVNTAAAPANTFEDCTTAQRTAIENVLSDALGHVNRATAALARAQATHPNLASITSSGLNTHFHTTDKDDIETIYRRFRDIQNAMQRGIDFECETSCDPGVGGYVWQFLFWMVGDIHICFNLFNNSSTHQQKATIIHEVAHRHAGVGDEAYVWESDYSTLSAKDAMDNADSYAHFALLF